MSLVTLATAARTPDRVRAAALFCLSLIACPSSVPAIAAEVSLALEPVSTYATGIFARSSAEVPAYCDASRRVFVVNAESGQVDVLALSAEGTLSKVGSIAAARDVPGTMKAVNSVAVNRGLLAVAVEADPPTAPGAVAFYDTRTLELRGSLPAGALPDMVTFSPDGRWVLVANEGESSHDATIDPEGTITVVDLAAGIGKATSRTVTFREWNAGGPRAGELPDLMARGLRHFGRVRLPGDSPDSRPATFAEDVEPEWIEVDPESRTAFVSLQEANAIAVIDIAVPRKRANDRGSIGVVAPRASSRGAIAQARPAPRPKGTTTPAAEMAAASRPCRWMCEKSNSIPIRNRSSTRPTWLKLVSEASRPATPPAALKTA